MEALGALVIAAGVVIVIVGLIRHALFEHGKSFTPSRLRFSHYLIMALELQLAAGILSTSVVPTWDCSDKRTAIALIRTVLNCFLTKALKDEQARQEPALLDRSRAKSKTLSPNRAS